VHPVHHHISDPIIRPLVREENFSDDEDFAKVVLIRNVKLGWGGTRRRGAWHGGVGYGGFESGRAKFGEEPYGGPIYRGAYGGHGMCLDYIGGETREYDMKIDLPSFNGHLHIEYFLD
jgi:hypothetical protein